jgi:hypothetical protein
LLAQRLSKQSEELIHQVLHLSHRLFQLLLAKLRSSLDF